MAGAAGLRAARAWGWAVPAIGVVAVLLVWPLAVLLWESLLRISPTVPDGTQFVGLANYAAVLTSPIWWSALLTTLVFTAIAVALQLALGVLFATSLRLVPFSWPGARLAVLIPALTLAVVSAATIEFAMTSGFARVWLRLDGPSDLASLVGLGVAEVWRGTGFVVVIVYLALARVPADLVESAAVAGSGRRTRVARLWWPAVSRALAVAAVFRVLDTLRVVEGPVLRDGPNVTHRPLTAVLWNDAFGSFQQGAASAQAVLLLLLALGIGLGLLRLVRRA